MIIRRREFLCWASSIAALNAAVATARADAYPSRAVRIIIATTAGGSTDIVARTLAQWLTDKLGQSFVAENRPGGNNNVGTELAAHAAPDGYTLFMANSVNTINTALYRNLTYDFVADFAPIVHAMSSPLLMMVAPLSSGKNASRVHYLCQSQPRQTQHGFGRQWIDRPFGRRVVRHDGRRQDDPCAVSRRVGGND